MNSSDTSRPDQLAASAASGGTPQPDCAPDGCKHLRIIDGLAEESRAAAIAQPAQQDSGADAAPADSTAASAPAEAAPAEAAPTVAAPAVISQ